MSKIPTPTPFSHHRLERYENAWFIVSIAMSLFLFIGVLASFFSGTYPSIKGEGSNHHLTGVENGRIDPQKLDGTPFNNLTAESAVRENKDGTMEVFLIGKSFQFQPATLKLPAGRPITFHITSVDVLHGFYIEGTNINSTVMPGQVSSFTTTFKKKGKYNVICNEYCGTGHHNMITKFTIE